MLVRVKVTTNAKKELVEQTKQDIFAISVKEKPKNNKANRRVQEILALSFGVPTTAVKMKSGHKKSKKLFQINN